MQPWFVEWCRISSLRADEDLLSARWDTIVKETRSLDAKHILGLVSFNSAKTTSPQIEDDLRHSFFKDATSSQKEGNELELRILGSAILRNSLDNAESDEARLTSLAVTCFSFGKGKVEIFVKELIRKAREVLHDESVKMRNTNSKITATRINDSEIIADPAKLAGVLQNLNKNTTAALKSVQRDLNVLSEESNILWWMIQKQSVDFREPFVKIKLPSRALVAGKELSDLVRMPLPPPSARSMLYQMVQGGTKTKVSIRAIAESVARNWREKTFQNLPQNIPANIVPLVTAVQNSLQVDEGDDWTPLFKKVTGFSGKEEFEPIDIATQICSELCLMRAVRPEVEA